MVVADDITSALSVAATQRGRARLYGKSVGVLAGLECAVASFQLLDPSCTVEVLLKDGDSFAPGDDVMFVEGAMAPLLAAERTALNFLQRLSGVATMTRQFVDRVAGTDAQPLRVRPVDRGRLASAAKEQGHCYRCKFRPAASFKVRAADAPRGPSTDARLAVN